ncbi:MAG TPA: hypothetical protein DD651_00640 [Trichococcus sp.]|nr:hypothetical protein [Trichococcus sp.]
MHKCGARRNPGLFVFAVSKVGPPKETVSSDERPARRKTDCAGDLNTGERMLAGGACVAVGRTPAKPRWSEVIAFWDLLLRQK